MLTVRVPVTPSGPKLKVSVEKSSAVLTFASFPRLDGVGDGGAEVVCVSMYQGYPITVQVSSGKFGLFSGVGGWPVGGRWTWKVERGIQ